MSRFAWTAAAVAALALGSYAAWSQDTPPKDAPPKPPAPAAPTRIGFVDVERVVNEWKRRDEVRKALKARSDGLSARFKQERTRIEEKEARLATLNETSDDFARLVREVDSDKFMLRRDQEYEKSRLEKEELRQVWMLYKAVVHESQAIAEAKGLACVMDWAPLTPEMDKAANPLQVVPKRMVVWADPRLDLTSEVLESLNAQVPPK